MINKNARFLNRIGRFCISNLLFFGKDFHTSFQAFFPMGNGDFVRCLYFGLIQQAVVGAGSACRIIFGLNGANIAGGNPGNPVNGLGEIVPAAHALVGIMIHARHECFVAENFQNGMG